MPEPVTTESDEIVTVPKTEILVRVWYDGMVFDQRVVFDPRVLDIASHPLDLVTRELRRSTEQVELGMLHHHLAAQRKPKEDK